jgi:hypothetical protein
MPTLLESVKQANADRQDTLLKGATPSVQLTID